MATKTTTTTTDDIDGSPADVTVSYSWQGQAYEIDLNDKNVEEFADALAPYLAASRKVTSMSGRTGGRRTAKGATTGAAAVARVGDFDPKDVRARAQANGVEVSARGRLTSAVLEQYRAAH